MELIRAGHERCTKDRTHQRRGERGRRRAWWGREGGRAGSRRSEEDRGGEDDVKVDEQKLANKCGGLAQTGAASASPRTRSSLFALRRADTTQHTSMTRLPHN